MPVDWEVAGLPVQNTKVVGNIIDLMAAVSAWCGSARLNR
jgi:hypothetical protein